MHFKIFTDGASKGNPGPSSIGAVIYDHHNEIVGKISENIGHGTNNQAEYEALIQGLKKVKELGCKNVSCYTDSELLTKHTLKKINVQNPVLVNKMREIRNMIDKDFDVFHIEHVSREKNQEADYLANLAHQQIENELHS